MKASRWTDPKIWTVAKGALQYQRLISIVRSWQEKEDLQYKDRVLEERNSAQSLLVEIIRGELSY